MEAKQLLFVIDPRPYETASQQAQANLAKDKALYHKAAADARRYAELIKKQFVSQQEYDQAKATAESLAATVKADEVAVQNARLNLSYCYLNANAPCYACTEPSFPGTASLYTVMYNPHGGANLNCNSCHDDD